MKEYFFCDRLCCCKVQIMGFSILVGIEESLPDLLHVDVIIKSFSENFRVKIRGNAL